SSALAATLRTVFAVFLLVTSAEVFAHAKGEDYVFVNFLEDRIEGEFQVNYDDLREKLGINLPEDKAEAKTQATASAEIVHNYIRENFSIGPKGDDPFAFEFQPPSLFEEASEYVRYPFIIESGSQPEHLIIRHDMYYQDDPTHRGLFLVQYNVKTDTDYGPEYTALIFSPGNNTQDLDLNNIPGLIEKNQMIYQGALHIWKGIDHVLFLLALLLPTVLIRRNNEWQPLDSAKTSLRNVLTIVTVFTVAHSVTLLLAALDLVTINSRLVESVIALSIIVVALNNIYQWISRGSLLTILLLGLFHGLGFASVMGNLPFRMVDLVGMVVRFNIGVELGQIAIVAVLFPLLYILRTRSFYVPVILKGGSWILIGIAAWWFVQRAFGVG
ncbi:MAG: HupE/UreJ family protein, partial [Pseudomonadota bacterium]